MKQEVYITNFLDTLKQLTLAKKYLETSFASCQEFSSKESLSEERLVQFEALTSCFARVVDMLIHKVFRAIDAVELTEGGTLIDVLNRAEKRGLIDGLSEMRGMKDLRNEIAHEYIADRLWLLHEEVFELTPRLLELVLRVGHYAERYR